MRIAKILVPIAFSKNCLAAARYAAALARQYQAELVLLHVTPPVVTEYGTLEPLMHSTEESVVANRARWEEAELADFLSGEYEDVEIRRVNLIGERAEVIRNYAHDAQCDVVVMATHGHGPLYRMVLGSVTAQLLHETDCAIWTAPHIDIAHPPNWQRVMCAVDLGPRTREIVSWAAHIAADAHARLACVHVVPDVELQLGPHFFDASWRMHLVNGAQEYIRWMTRNMGVDADVDIETGGVAEGVAEAAEHLHADLTVIGHSHERGLTGYVHAHAYNILRRAHCPVVSVPV